MKKHTYEYIKEQIEQTGWKLLSETYVNSSFKLLVECPKRHQYRVTYANFKRGRRCPICCGNQKHTYEYIKYQYEKENWKLLSKKYINGNIKLLVECSNGHQHLSRYNDFQQGYRCPICYGNKKHSYDYIKSKFEKYGWKLLSNEYKNRYTKLLVECPEGHQYWVTYGNFQQGYGCPVCWNIKTHSRSEKECLNVIKQLTNENIIENDRTQIINPNTNKYLELDIYIPSLNKAIEFNGEYWHSFNSQKYKDNQKVKQCKEKNIDLLTIWYQNWIDDRGEQIEKMKDFIGVIK